MLTRKRVLIHATTFLRQYSKFNIPFSLKNFELFLYKHFFELQSQKQTFFFNWQLNIKEFFNIQDLFQDDAKKQTRLINRVCFNINKHCSLK